MGESERRTRIHVGCCIIPGLRCSARGGIIRGARKPSLSPSLAAGSRGGDLRAKRAFLGAAGLFFFSALTRRRGRRPDAP